MTATTKRLVFAAGGLAIATLLVLLFRPSPVLVETATARRGSLRVTVDEEGKTRVRDRFVVSAPVSGRLSRIELHEGDSLERGTVVALLAPLPLDERTRAEGRARLQAAIAAERAAQARVQRAATALEQAKRSHIRADQLAAQGTLAPEVREQAELSEETLARDLESTRFAARAAVFDVETARSALLAAQADRPSGAGAEVALRAPVTGRVLRLLQESERSVSAGTPLIEIGDPASLEIVLDLLSEDAVKVRSGAPLRVDGGDGHPLAARVRTIEPSAFTKVSALGVEEQRVNVIADFSEHPDRLGDGYRVVASIVVWEGNGVLKVPGSSLFRRGDGWSVFVVDGGRARRREVEIGHRNATEAEVVRGLAEGDFVILHPGDLVRDRVRVLTATDQGSH
jgi:HlyD family secretion protein